MDRPFCSGWLPSAAPDVWPVHVLGAEVLTSLSPWDALSPFGGAARAGAVPGGKRHKPHPSY